MNENALQSKFERLHKEFSLRDIAGNYRYITCTDVGRIVRGKFPRDNKKRIELGLPIIIMRKKLPSFWERLKVRCPEDAKDIYMIYLSLINRNT